MMRRAIIVAAMLAGTALVTAPLFTDHPPRLMWNASASVPIGLYLITPVTARSAAATVEVGDLVVVSPPEDLAAFLAERGYLPRDVPLLKRALVLPGGTVCRRGATIIALGRAWGDAQSRDRFGRDLPVWQGCRVIADDEIFLMNWDTPDSLDGRYFGPLPITSITARATPLWTDERGDGRYEWRASMR